MDQAARAPGSRRRRGGAERSQEILDAALAEFAVKGYAAARLDDVARRAGVAKGTIYLYFDSKEALFREMVRRSIVPSIEDLGGAVDRLAGSAEEFLRSPFRAFVVRLIESDARLIVRLMIAEGHRFPDLTRIYFDEVIARGMAVLGRLVARGVACGEFRPSALDEFPQLLIAPALMALVWKALFEPYRPLDVDRMIGAHIDLVLDGLKGAGGPP